MNRLTLFFIGIFGTFSAAWLGLVVAPYVQIGHLKPEINEESKEPAPPSPSGNAFAGEKVYAANGCVTCHSQQVRSADQGSDIARGWGKRPTVARDYIWQERVFLGTTRLGQDLSNVGDEERIPKQTAALLHKHLYAPKTVTPGSIMPPHKYLYQTRKVQGQVSAEALQLEGEDKPAHGYEVIPTQQARDLVAYLLSLNKSAYTLREAP